MFDFLHGPIFLFHKTSTVRQEPQVFILFCLYMFFFTPKVTVAII